MFYLQMDILQLADVFDNFVENIILILRIVTLYLVIHGKLV